MASLCPECLGRGFVYSPGGYAPKLVCPICHDDDGAFAAELPIRSEALPAQGPPDGAADQNPQSGTHP